jgi:hypothetical protein
MASKYASVKNYVRPVLPTKARVEVDPEEAEANHQALCDKALRQFTPDFTTPEESDRMIGSMKNNPFLNNVLTSGVQHSLLDFEGANGKYKFIVAKLFKEQGKKGGFRNDERAMIFRRFTFPEGYQTSVKSHFMPPSNLQYDIKVKRWENASDKLDIQIQSIYNSEHPIIPSDAFEWEAIKEAWAFYGHQAIIGIRRSFPILPKGIRFVVDPFSTPLGDDAPDYQVMKAKISPQTLVAYENHTMGRGITGFRLSKVLKDDEKLVDKNDFPFVRLGGYFDAALLMQDDEDFGLIHVRPHFRVTHLAVAADLPHFKPMMPDTPAVLYQSDWIGQGGRILNYQKPTVKGEKDNAITAAIATEGMCDSNGDPFPRSASSSSGATAVKGGLGALADTIAPFAFAKRKTAPALPEEQPEEQKKLKKGTPIPEEDEEEDKEMSVADYVDVEASVSKSGGKGKKAAAKRK